MGAVWLAPAITAALPWWSVHGNSELKQTLSPSSCIASVFQHSNRTSHPCRKGVLKSGVVAMINLSILWFVSLWNWFIGGILKVLARKVLECCKQRPMSYSGRSLEEQKTKRNRPLTGPGLQAKCIFWQGICSHSAHVLRTWMKFNLKQKVEQKDKKRMCVLVNWRCMNKFNVSGKEKAEDKIAVILRRRPLHWVVVCVNREWHS